MDKKKILVVEDDESLRQLYVDILTQEGYMVESAKDGLEGLEKLKKGGWDLALLDIVLPEINGFEIARRVKLEVKTPVAKSTVFITNLYEDSQIKEALSLGDGYLIKSQITPDTFINEVKLYISGQKASPGEQTPPVTKPPAQN